LGRGGFGTVYRATDTALGRPVALKILHPELVVDPEFINRFYQEARIAASLDHTNIVALYDVGEQDGRYFIAMKYLPNQSLADRIKQGPLSWAQAVETIRQVCAGVQKLHERGWVHRDLKPANILFDAEGHAVVTDFGLARAQTGGSGKSSTTGGTGVGTSGYRAPELWRGRPPASPATDVYALGCILAEELTGKAIFEGATLEETLARHLATGPVFGPNWPPKDAPGELVNVIGRALRRDPTDRYPDAAAFAAEIEKCLAGSVSENTPAVAVQPAEGAGRVFTPPAPVSTAVPAGLPARPPDAVPAASFRQERKVIQLAPGVDMEFVHVPAGEFSMGSGKLIHRFNTVMSNLLSKEKRVEWRQEEGADNDEYPPHLVYLDDYWIGRYPVTVRQYRAFLSVTGSKLPEMADEYAHHPTRGITWFDAGQFCEWLSRAANCLVRLPTEAEWEKAARGLDGRLYPWGNELPNTRRCNFDNRVGSTSPVGKYSPLGDSYYGCADMAGNVWEWVVDHYGSDYYLKSSKRNPQGPDDSSHSRVLRGGSWESGIGAMRCANRSNRDISDYYIEHHKEYFLTCGFRCAI
jgi:serine/threonine-protein kinase